MDVDRGALKAVQLSKSGGNYVLRHVGYHRLPPGAIMEGEVADTDLLAAEIKEFWSSHSFKGKSVVLGVANQRVVVRLLNFPHMEEQDLDRKSTRLNSSHANISYAVFCLKKKKNKNIS